MCVRACCPDQQADAARRGGLGRARHVAVNELEGRGKATCFGKIASLQERGALDLDVCAQRQLLDCDTSVGPRCQLGQVARRRQTHVRQGLTSPQYCV